MSKAYDPKPIEEKWYPFWKENGFFKADPTSKKTPFSIVIPPPNVTGKLHMGHALVNTLQDILIRWKRMKGFEALWVPGTDHAGIATQTVVEKNLFQKTGKRRKDFSREEFLAHIWAWKEESGSNILSQLEKLGCSCDWDRLRFTMDSQNNRAVRAAFKKMYDEKLIYRGDYLVNWDPVAMTALSDDEVEHEERASFLWYIRYPIVGESGTTLTVATTRPETLFGDVAVAVHPSDERYQQFIGKKVHLPLTDRTLPILADPFIDPSFGTGVVKITPAHDFNDFEVGRRHNLERINILTPDARLNQSAGSFEHLTVDEARPLIVKALKEKGLLEKEEPYTLRVGVSYRSKAVIQPYLSKQWFVKMAPFKEKLISAVKEKRVKIIPSHFESTYFHWIESLRDWCISRQLWWGHQIPIWYKDDQIICSSDEGLPPEIAKDPAGWTQDPDVLDTWFSSALWPLATLGWPDQTLDLAKFYPTSVLITGHDILFFWVARMILMGEYLSDLPPFHETYLHGLIYGKSYWKTNVDGSVTYITGDEKKKYDLGGALPSLVSSKWEKMSKSKGNIIDPIEVIEEYGTDALRLTLCSSVTFARQIDLDKRRFEEYKNFINKIWNGARFVFLHVESLTPEEFSQGLDFSLFTIEDKWIFSLLHRTIAEMEKALSSYTFDVAAKVAYEFFWNDFCSTYLEAIKPSLFGRQGDETLQKNKKKALVILLLSLVRLLHPIIPFLTEELFSKLKSQFNNNLSSNSDPYTQEALSALAAPSCIVAPYPTIFSPRNLPIEEQFTSLLELIRTIRNIRTEMGIPPSEKTELYICGERNELVKAHEDLILALTPTSKIYFVDQKPTGFQASSLWENLHITIPLPTSLKEKEKIRIEKEKEKLEKLKISTEEKLSNPDFRARAPSHVVEKLEAQLTKTEKELSELINLLPTL